MELSANNFNNYLKGQIFPIHKNEPKFKFKIAEESPISLKCHYLRDEKRYP